MAIKSAVSYIFNEEQDGFVAVDFNFINGHDDEIRDWEIIDDFSSIDEKCDDDVDFTGSVQSDVSSEYLSDQIAGEDAKSVPEYSPEIIVSHRQSTADDGDVMSYQLGEDDDDDDEDSSSSDDFCENGEDLLRLFAVEDLKSVPEYSPETIVRHCQSTAVDGDVMAFQLGEDDDEDSSSSDDFCENGEDLLRLFAVEDLKSVPEYSPETIVRHCQSTAVVGDVMEYQLGEDDEDEDSSSSDDLCENGEDLHQLFADEDLKSVPEIIVGNNQFDDVEAVQEIITSHRQFDVIDDDVILYEATTTVYDYDYDYSYYHDHDRQEEEEDYDLDDELVSYSVKIKLGRERIRKLGKRSCSKSVKSKRLTYNYNKAGCFRGKHGLELKHI